MLPLCMNHKIQQITQHEVKQLMTCKICGMEETDNPDEICDDCKASIVCSDDIFPSS